jgi:outer membrane protein OmpA-like peptidoglycan-associated protein
MAQSVYIAAPHAHITVSMFANFSPSISWSPEPGQPSDFTEKDYATHRLAEGKWRANLDITALLAFPPNTWRRPREDDIVSFQYVQAVTATLTNIRLEGGKITFSDKKEFLEHKYFLPYNGPENSILRFIEGSVYLDESSDPTTSIIRISLSLGVGDAYSTSWSNSTQEAQSKRTYDFEVFKLEATSDDTTRSTGGALTPGQLITQRSWTLTLLSPEPRPQPVPLPLPVQSFTVYFPKGLSDADTFLNKYNPDPDNKNSQPLAMKAFLMRIVNKYGKDNITKVVVIGHTSKEGGAEDNNNLSDRRCDYVMRYLRRWNLFPMNVVEPPQSLGPPLGDATPVDAKDRKVELKVMLKPGAKPQGP